jgi:hypothetical protein
MTKLWNYFDGRVVLTNQWYLHIKLNQMHFPFSFFGIFESCLSKMIYQNNQDLNQYNQIYVSETIKQIHACIKETYK